MRKGRAMSSRPSSWKRWPARGRSCRRGLPENGVAHVAFVFEPPVDSKVAARTNDLVTEFEYLPDAMVIEAEWQASLSALRELEAVYANQKHRPAAALFLRQARFALILRRLFPAHNIGHVHATSSGTLLCALLLRNLLGVSISVAIEAKPTLSEPFIL